MNVVGVENAPKIRENCQQFSIQEFTRRWEAVTLELFASLASQIPHSFRSTLSSLTQTVRQTIAPTTLTADGDDSDGNDDDDDRQHH